MKKYNQRVVCLLVQLLQVSDQENAMTFIPVVKHLCPRKFVVYLHVSLIQTALVYKFIWSTWLKFRRHKCFIRASQFVFNCILNIIAIASSLHWTYSWKQIGKLYYDWDNFIALPYSDWCCFRLSVLCALTTAFACTELTVWTQRSNN